jgi:uncharacterized membrane protein
MAKDNNLLTGIIIAVVVILLLGVVSFSARIIPGYGYGMMNGYGSGMMFFGWITWILIIILIISAIYWLIISANRN